MRNLIKIFILLGFFILTSNACGKRYSCDAGDPEIVGAKCNDGTTSNATGQGACSHHDGVAYWLCCCE